jgi:uncharacterized membrane protein YdbT with pleckstrin-like domain
LPTRPRPLYAGEEILVDIRPHWVFLIGPLVTTVAVIAVAVALDIDLPHSGVGWHWVEGAVAAVPLVWLVIRFARWRATSLVVTSFRVVECRGVVSKVESEVRLSDIDRVDVVQTPVQRALGTGQLELTLRSDQEVRVIGDVRKPAVLQRIINRRRPPLPGFQPVPR